MFPFVSVTESRGIHLSKHLCDAFGGTEYSRGYRYATDFRAILGHKAPSQSPSLQFVSRQ